MLKTIYLFYILKADLQNFTVIIDIYKIDFSI